MDRFGHRVAPLDEHAADTLEVAVQQIAPAELIHGCLHQQVGVQIASLLDRVQPPCDRTGSNDPSQPQARGEHLGEASDIDDQVRAEGS